ncbi:MAG: SDR family NAD(P)-dependent oxidoreductase [Rhodothermales bacterium]
MKTDLTGKTIVLTGAFGRLGRILTRRLLADGATVAGLDARAADPVVASDRLHLFKADLADEASVAEAFAEVERTVGAAAGLVHTVGMWSGKPFAETSLEAWETMMRVNLTSAFLCFRAAVRQMQAGGTGRLVAIASKQGADRGVAEQAAYSASKAGVVRLVEAVAAEYVGTGITAAAVAPSTILFEGGGDGVPAEQVAALCAYLCTDEGAAHNGSVLRTFGSAVG